MVLVGNAPSVRGKTMNLILSGQLGLTELATTDWSAPASLAADISATFNSRGALTPRVGWKAGTR